MNPLSRKTLVAWRQVQRVDRRRWSAKTKFSHPRQMLVLEPRDDLHGALPLFATFLSERDQLDKLKRDIEAHRTRTGHVRSPGAS